MFIDLFAAFLNDPFQFVGFLRREASERAGESRFAPCLADRLEPPDETGGYFQPVRRQGLQILEDVIERTHQLLRYTGPITLASNRGSCMIDNPIRWEHQSHTEPESSESAGEPPTRRVRATLEHRAAWQPRTTYISRRICWAR